jgi:hypothetical protein
MRYNGTTGAFMDVFVPAGSGNLGGPTFLVFHAFAPTSVPEPSTLALIGLGIVVLAWRVRRRVPPRPRRRD